MTHPHKGTPRTHARAQSDDAAVLQGLPALEHPAPIPRGVRRSPALLALVVLLPVTLGLAGAMLWTMQTRIIDLQQELVVARTDAARAGADAEFYKRAYELTLDDIRVLSKSYGGEDAYERLSEELRQREIGTVLGGVSQNTTYLIRNPGLWREYASMGAVSSTCLAQSTTIDTVHDTVLLRLRGNATDLGIYIDGNFLLRANLTDAQSGFLVVLPNGDHELSFSGSTGARVDAIAFDDQPVPVSALTMDAGKGWSMFDCVNSSRAAALSSPGALRVLISKS